MKLKQRERVWTAWVRLLQRLHGSLRYTASPIQELLAHMDKQDLSALGWLSMFEEKATTLACPSVSEEERPFAEAFFSTLGATDLDGQLEHIRQYTQRAKEAADAAGELYRRRGKAYAVTGVCAGLCIGLMLI